MTIRQNHTPLLRALLLLFVFTTAYAGRSLHTHSAEYYWAQRAQSSDETGGTIVDSCPICHFHLFTNLPAGQLALTVFFVLLSAVFVLSALSGSAALPQRVSLRAPPAAA